MQQNFKKEREVFMTNNQKQQLIAEVVALLQHRITEMEQTKSSPQTPPQSVEMLTIKECSECIKGLSMHTVRQLVLQGKIPSVRTGAGKNGKILISKSALLTYFNEIGGAA
jgi:excisionase family DNA binding protein